MDAIFEQFVSEARDNLSYLDQHLNELENGDEETINALFRAAHTLKGGAGLVEFHAVKEVTHKAEDLLDAFRNKKVAYSPELVDTLYEAFDEVVELIDAAQEKGEVVEADEALIEKLKKDIASFMQEDANEKQEDGVLETNLPLGTFEEAQVFSKEAFLSLLDSLPLFAPKLDNTFLQERHYWMVDMDLDEETLKFGNDPYYLLFLLGEESVASVFVELNGNCESLEEDPLLWKSRVLAVVESEHNEMEEVFYNVLDETLFSPLSVASLFCTNYESMPDEAFEAFVKEIPSLLAQKAFEVLIQKSKELKEQLDSKSKESVLVERLIWMGEFLLQEPERLEEILPLLGEVFGFESASEISTQTQQNQDSFKSEEGDERLVLDEKDKKAALNILSQQQKLLSYAKDAYVVDRTKEVLQNLLGFLGLKESLEDLESVEALQGYIEALQKRIEQEEQESVTTPSKESLKSQPQVAQPVKEQKQTKKVESSTTSKEPSSFSKGSNVAQRASKKEQGSGESKIAKTVKIDQKEIDMLMDIVGELLVMKNALPYIASNIGEISTEQSRREVINKYEEISRVTDQLQDRVMGMRLLPLSYIFGRYPKLVRDLSKKLGKKIKYVEEGGDTKLDKMMIEKLADPLIHIIRNSLDHGLETPDERKAMGKEESGELKISATSQGDRVLITISDDGRGIDVQKVVMKALEKGLIDSERVDSMSEEEKLMLIFHAGLSTKEEISDLSGRGVGADAVKKTIEELGGKISLKSRQNVGTTLSLELPVSVALTNVFHIKMNAINYAIAMDYIIETVKIEKHQIKTANHKPFIKMRGELIPLLFEKTLLGRGFEPKEEENVVVLQGESLRYGLVVDSFVNQLNVVQKPLGGVMGEHPFISGSSLLGNGEVLFVLDTSKIIKES